MNFLQENQQKNKIYKIFNFFMNNALATDEKMIRKNAKKILLQINYADENLSEWIKETMIGGSKWLVQIIFV